MSEEIVEKFCHLQERLAADEEYMALNREYRNRGDEFMAVLEELSPHQRNVIMDYLDVFVQMHIRMVVAACEQS